MDGGLLCVSNIKLVVWIDYFVVSEYFVCDYMSYCLLSIEVEIKVVLIELNKICCGEVFIIFGEKGCVFLKSGMLQIVLFWLCNVVDIIGVGDVFYGVFIYGVYYLWYIDNIILFVSLIVVIFIEKKGVWELMFDLVVVYYLLNSYERNLM